MPGRATGPGETFKRMWLLQLKTLLRSLILPPSGALLLGFCGLLLLGRRPRTARWMIVVALGSLWLLSTPIIADAMVRLTERWPALDLGHPSGAQAIVILGGGGQREFAPEYAGPAAEPILLERLGYGAYVAVKTGLPLLVTGFHVEAHAMAATLVQLFGLTPRWVDDQSYDTFENARHSVAILRAAGILRIILVTHSTHLPRAVEEFRAAGIEVVPAPVGVLTERDQGVYRYLPNTAALLRSNAAIYELIGGPVRTLLAVTHLRHQ